MDDDDNKLVSGEIHRRNLSQSPQEQAANLAANKFDASAKYFSSFENVVAYTMRDGSESPTEQSHPVANGTGNVIYEEDKHVPQMEILGQHCCETGFTNEAIEVSNDDDNNPKDVNGLSNQKEGLVNGCVSTDDDDGDEVIEDSGTEADPDADITENIEVICEPTVVNRNYGRVFMNPPLNLRISKTCPKFHVYQATEHRWMMKHRPLCEVPPLHWLPAFARRK